MPANAPQPTAEPTVTKSKSLPILLSVLVILLIITGFLGFKYFTGGTIDLASIGSRFQAAKDQQPKPSPKPIKPIGTGTQEFFFSHGSEMTGPRIQKVILDPINPQPNQQITIHVTIENDTPLTKSDIIIETDNKTNIQKMITTDNNSYLAELKLKDTYDYNYYIKFDLQSESGNYDGGLRLRQPQP